MRCAPASVTDSPKTWGVVEAGGSSSTRITVTPFRPRKRNTAVRASGTAIVAASPTTSTSAATPASLLHGTCR